MYKRQAQLLQNEELRQQMAASAQQKVAAAFDVRPNVGQLAQWLAEPTHETAVSPTIQTLIDDLTLSELPVPMPLTEVFAIL